MQTVVETPAFIRAAKEAGMDDGQRGELVTMLASNPAAGEIIQGTGGLRKLRYAKAGAGKSGGFRVCTYYHSENYPVFLITVFGKSQKANLTNAERNAIAKLLRDLAANYMKRKDAE